ncbi:MAG: polysaccharide biosynthesis/export family protein [Cytophagales bacterium]|nr:polysaccharide biosynthesis/export family protein [Cytophagales bacterium]
MKIRFPIFFAGLLLAGLSGCGSYKQNIMLRTPEGFTSAALSKEVLHAERNYVIQQNDLLHLEVFTNKGERIIDPNPIVSQSGTTSTGTQQRPQVSYLIDLNGVAKLPVIGEMKLENLTLRQAESILQIEYEKYFKDSFVVLTFANKRVIVLGAVGGQVIPLLNHNVTLAEVLASTKGLPNEAKANNIRIVRKDQVFQVDLSTMQGFLAGNMILEPGDIIYIEPVRRPFAEGLRDYAGLASLVISTLSLLIVVQSTR